MKFAHYILTASVLFSLAYADVDNNKEKKKKEPPPPKPDCSLSLPCTEKHAMFDVFGEYLYWQVKEDQLNYAADIEGGIGSITDFFDDLVPPASFNPVARIKEADSRWHSGWRVGAGFFLECSTWDVQAFWTHLHDNTRTSISDPQGGIFPLELPLSSLIGILGGTTPTLFTGASNNWNFKFDTADLQVGKSFFVKKTASFRPFIGLKGARIYQHLNTSYTGLTVDIGPDDVPDIVGLGLGSKKKNNFLAGGPSFGVNSGWQFAKGWTISNDFSFAFLYGRFKTALHSLVEIPSILDATVTVEDNKHRLRPMVEGRIGIDWKECFGDYFLLNIGAGYEVQYWWNQWQAPSSVSLSLLNASSSPQGDLMLQGLVVHLGLAF